MEQGEDLWQTRRDEEAVARDPSAAAWAALGEAEAGQVSHIWPPLSALQCSQDGELRPVAHTSRREKRKCRTPCAVSAVSEQAACRHGGPSPHVKSVVWGEGLWVCRVRLLTVGSTRVFCRQARPAPCPLDSGPAQAALRHLSVRRHGVTASCLAMHSCPQLMLAAPWAGHACSITDVSHLPVTFLQGPLAADADDPAVVDSEDERKHKMEAQAARHHDTLDIFAEQARHQLLTHRSLAFRAQTAIPPLGGLWPIQRL